MGKRVLLVEDDTDVRETLASALEYHGYEVYPAATAAEALAVLRAWPPALLVLDLNGVGDGTALARAAVLQAVPVVLSSASSEQYLAAARIRLGAQDVLAKPFDLDNLALVVGAAVRVARHSTTAVLVS
jgi:DNA-binding response OmpR family regulator